jgi:hypothetical protein
VCRLEALHWKFWSSTYTCMEVIAGNTLPIWLAEVARATVGFTVVEDITIIGNHLSDADENEDRHRRRYPRRTHVCTIFKVACDLWRYSDRLKLVLVQFNRIV